MNLYGKDEIFTRECEVCGDHIGVGYNHAQCSVIKQARYADVKHRSAPKKLDNKQADYMAMRYR